MLSDRSVPPTITALEKNSFVEGPKLVGLRVPRLFSDLLLNRAIGEWTPEFTQYPTR